MQVLWFVFNNECSIRSLKAVGTWSAIITHILSIYSFSRGVSLTPLTNVYYIHTNASKMKTASIEHCQKKKEILFILPEYILCMTHYVLLKTTAITQNRLSWLQQYNHMNKTLKFETISKSNNGKKISSWNPSCYAKRSFIVRALDSVLVAKNDHLEKKRKENQISSQFLVLSTIC